MVRIKGAAQKKGVDFIQPPKIMKETRKINYGAELKVTTNGSSPLRTRPEGTRPERTRPVHALKSLCGSISESI